MNLSELTNFYLDMECLDVGKTSEEAGNFHDFIADTKSDLQCQDLDTRDDGAWVLLRPSLHAPKEQTIQITYLGHIVTLHG